MKKSLVLICASALSIFAFGCKGTEEVNCTENPSERACVEACTVDPTLSHCTDTDAGPDTGVSDGGVDVDTGPESPCEEECTGETSLCNETTMLCVQCIEAEDCEGMGVNTMCSDAGMCVQCLGNADCTEPVASVCSTDEATAGTCVACAAATSDVDCAGVVDGETALNVCDESGDAGVCVQCNASDESACDPNVCDVVAKTCTDDTLVGMTPTCGSCVSDRQCLPGQTCAPTEFGDADAGHYCLWNLNADEMAPIACSTVRPFGTPENVDTIGGQSAEVCTLRLTTCPAYNDFSTPGRGSPSCSGEETSEADADCGHPDLDDGFCVEEDAASDLCSTRCTSDVDCVFGPLRDEYTCDMGTGLCSFTLL